MMSDLCFWRDSYSDDWDSDFPEIPLNLVEFGQHVEPLYYNETEVSFEVYFEISKSIGIVNGFL